jgi:hypothetical protein
LSRRSQAIIRYFWNRLEKAEPDFLLYLKPLIKATAIFFLSIYLLSATEAGQLLKLPLVFQHYKEHKAWDNNISFLEFLKLHYLHANPMDPDYDRDMQLPFKKTDNFFAAVTVASLPVVLTVMIARPVELPEKNRMTPQDHNLPSPYLSAIWQPPKRC